MKFVRLTQRNEQGKTIDVFVNLDLVGEMHRLQNNETRLWYPNNPEHDTRVLEAPEEILRLAY